MTTAVNPWLALPDGRPQLLGARGLAAHVPAVAAHAGDRRAGGEDRREAGGPGVAALQHRPPSVAQVPDGRHTGREVPAQPVVEIAEVYDAAEARLVIEACRRDYARHYG